MVEKKRECRFEKEREIERGEREGGLSLKIVGALGRMVREGAAMEDELVRQFKHLDSNRDGFLNRKELEAGMRECKIAIPSEVGPLLCNSERGGWIRRGQVPACRG